MQHSQDQTTSRIHQVLYTNIMFTFYHHRYHPNSNIENIMDHCIYGQISTHHYFRNLHNEEQMKFALELRDGPKERSAGNRLHAWDQRLCWSLPGSSCALCIRQLWFPASIWINYWWASWKHETQNWIS